MSKLTKENAIRKEFWKHYKIDQLNINEWEALCDGCGKCCLQKLEDENTNEIEFTKISCRLLDTETCKCGQYANRKDFVPDCVVLTPRNLKSVAYWMPNTCAYRLLYEKKPLFDWHPLVSGTNETVHKAGVSVKGWAIPEFEVSQEDWEDYIIEQPEI